MVVSDQLSFLYTKLAICMNDRYHSWCVYFTLKTPMPLQERHVLERPGTGVFMDPVSPCVLHLHGNNYTECRQYPPMGT